MCQSAGRHRLWLGFSISPTHKYLLFLEVLINDRCPTFFNALHILATIHCSTSMSICSLLSSGKLENIGVQKALINRLFLARFISVYIGSESQMTKQLSMQCKNALFE